MTTALLLTVAQLKEHIETDLGANALQRILDSEEAEIIRLYGATATHTETVVGNDKLLFLSRPASAFTSITEIVGSPFGETSTVLSANDYRSWYGGRMIERLATGTNQRSRWGDRITVVYTPVSDSDQRKKVLMDLCRLALQYNALQSERVGDYSSQSLNYTAERTKLLRSLDPNSVLGFA